METRFIALAQPLAERAVKEGIDQGWELYGVLPMVNSMIASPLNPTGGQSVMTAVFVREENRAPGIPPGNLAALIAECQNLNELCQKLFNESLGAIKQKVLGAK